MSDRSKDASIPNDDPPFKSKVNKQGEVDTPVPVVKTSYPLLLVYAALFGAGAALLTAAYITVYNWGVKFFEQPSHFGLTIGRFWPLILLSVGGLLLGLAIKFTGQRGGLGVAQREYSEAGRINPRNLPSIMLEAMITLWSGAAVGPEGPLVFLTGGVGSWCADRLKLAKDDVPLLVYCAIAGAFGGFLGSPIIGAVGAIEYMFIHELNYYRHAIPGLLAASFGWGIYFALLHTSFMGIYSFPNYASPRIVDLGWALLIGVIAGVIGTVYKVIFGVVHLVFAPLKQLPVIRAVVGGILIGLIGSFLPLALYSGQNQLLEIIHNPAAYGVGLLLLLLLAKALLTSTSYATGFDGGPIFPLLFIGGTLGLAISQVFPFIPQGVGVTTGMAGIASAVFPIPLTVALLLGLMGGQTDLTPVITIGAVIGFLTAKALAPLLPKPKPTSTESSASEAKSPATSATANTDETN
ncbi:MAG: chloride channel protein [Ktedonobacteraceae bacterium]